MNSYNSHNFFLFIILRSQTCPHCRSKVTEKQIIKLYFHNNSNLSVKEDISSLTHQVQALSFQNTLKDQEIKNLLKETKKDKEQLISLKYNKIYYYYILYYTHILIIFIGNILKM